MTMVTCHIVSLNLLLYDKSCFECAKDYQSIGYAMPRHRVIDIDTHEDWDYACAMAKAVEELKLD